MECIILAGGLGTRLRNVIGEAPKCMAPIAGAPFLYYLLSYLQQQQVTRVILSLGYRHEAVLQWLDEHGKAFSFSVDYVIEHEPLGTGGGVRLALEQAEAADVMVCNGDTMFDVNARELFDRHQRQQAAATIALKELKHFDRYGVVHTDTQGRILSFEEKRACEQGLINGGVYVINKDYLHSKQLPARFSFEQHFLEQFVAEQRFLGYTSDAYFIDIGVPGDYEQAQRDFPALFP